MTDTYRIKYTVGGRSFEISPDSPIKLLENGIYGLDSTGFDVKITPYASGNGGHATTRRFAEREISLTVEIDRGAGEEVRRHMVSLLDPAKAGELEVEIFGVHRKISVIPCGEPEFSRPTLWDSVTVRLNFVAPAVFFSDISKKRAEYYCAMPLLTFPMNFTEESGITPGLYGKTDHVSLKNDGDTDCGLVVTAVAHGGTVVNPTVSLGEKRIKCISSLNDGDVLQIDTRPGRKNITVNGERFFSFSRDSVFFTLPAGGAVVTIGADSGGEFIDARVEYTPLYYGV